MPSFRPAVLCPRVFSDACRVCEPRDLVHDPLRWSSAVPQKCFFVTFYINHLKKNLAKPRRNPKLTLKKPQMNTKETPKEPYKHPVRMYVVEYLWGLSARAADNFRLLEFESTIYKFT